MLTETVVYITCTSLCSPEVDLNVHEVWLLTWLTWYLILLGSVTHWHSFLPWKTFQLYRWSENRQGDDRSSDCGLVQSVIDVLNQWIRKETQTKWQRNADWTQSHVGRPCALFLSHFHAIIWILLIPWLIVIFDWYHDKNETIQHIEQQQCSLLVSAFVFPSGLKTHNHYYTSSYYYTAEWLITSSLISVLNAAKHKNTILSYPFPGN